MQNEATNQDSDRIFVTRVEDDATSTFYLRNAKALTDHDSDGHPLYAISNLWGTQDGFGTVGPGRNPEPILEPLFPGVGGIRFVICTFFQNSFGGADETRWIVAEDDQSAESNFGGLADSFDASRPGMHLSDTIDCVHVLSGKMIMVLDRKETLVQKGDSIIMRGAWHAWRNEWDEPCVVSSVMIGCNREDS